MSGKAKIHKIRIKQVKIKVKINKKKGEFSQSGREKTKSGNLQLPGVDLK